MRARSLRCRVIFKKNHSQNRKGLRERRDGKGQQRASYKNRLTSRTIREQLCAPKGNQVSDMPTIEFVRTEIERMRTRVHRQRGEIRRARISQLPPKPCWIRCSIPSTDYARNDGSDHRVIGTASRSSARHRASSGPTVPAPHKRGCNCRI
jgi:hypothetical protein